MNCEATTHNSIARFNRLIDVDAVRVSHTQTHPQTSFNITCLSYNAIEFDIYSGFGVLRLSFYFFLFTVCICVSLWFHCLAAHPSQVTDPSHWFPHSDLSKGRIQMENGKNEKKIENSDERPKTHRRLQNCKLRDFKWTTRNWMKATATANRHRNVSNKISSCARRATQTDDRRRNDRERTGQTHACTATDGSIYNRVDGAEWWQRAEKDRERMRARRTHIQRYVG